jgi:hypothetical protein
MAPIATAQTPTPFDPPRLQCVAQYSTALKVQVCGGGWGGAMGGFRVYYQTRADADAHGFPILGGTGGASLCQIDFTGPAYELGEDECVMIQLGQFGTSGPGVTGACVGTPLVCDTEYAIVVIALANDTMSQSDVGDIYYCTTDCDTPPPTGGGTGGNPFDPPQLFCDTAYSNAINVRVCGGGWGGATAGFTVYYQTLADFNTHGFPALGGTASPSLCEATFTGPTYSLTPDECVTIQFGANANPGDGVSSSCIGNPLQCGTQYVFIAYALASDTMDESDFAQVFTCTTDSDCGNTAPGTDPGEGGGCTYTQGYWKNHPEAWPVTSLTLGTVNYTQQQLLQIFAQPVRGNGLVKLAHQLIAAKLNVANGADDTEIAATIAAADALIGGRVVPPIGTGSLSNGAVGSLNDTLDAYNNGDIGPGHCDESSSSPSNGGKGKNKNKRN